MKSFIPKWRRRLLRSGVKDGEKFDIWRYYPVYDDEGDGQKDDQRTASSEEVIHQGNTLDLTRK